MALLNCQDCGREVSSRAHHCVHCGRPWPGSRCCGAGIAVLAGLVLAGLAAAGIIVCKSRCESRARANVMRCESAGDLRVQESRMKAALQKTQEPAAPASAPGTKGKDY